MYISNYCFYTVLSVVRYLCKEREILFFYRRQLVHSLPVGKLREEITQGISYYLDVPGMELTEGYSLRIKMRKIFSWFRVLHSHRIVLLPHALTEFSCVLVSYVTSYLESILINIRKQTYLSNIFHVLSNCNSTSLC